MLRGQIFSDSLLGPSQIRKVLGCRSSFATMAAGQLGGTSEKEEGAAYNLVTDIANQIRESVRSYTATPGRRTPRLVGVTTSNEESTDLHAEKYSEQIRANCAEDGIDYKLWRIPENPHDVEAAIQRAKESESVHGVLVFYPIFQNRPALELRQRNSILEITPNQGKSCEKRFDATDAAKRQRGPYKNRLTGVYYKTYDDFFRDNMPHTLDVEGLSHGNNSRSLHHSKGYMDDGPAFVDIVDSRIIFPCTGEYSLVPSIFPTCSRLLFFVLINESI